MPSGYDISFRLLSSTGGVGVGPWTSMNTLLLALGSPDSDPGSIWGSMTDLGASGIRFSLTADGTKRDGFSEGAAWDLSEIRTLVGATAEQGVQLRATISAMSDASSVFPVVHFGGAGTYGSPYYEGLGWMRYNSSTIVGTHSGGGSVMGLAGPDVEATWPAVPTWTSYYTYLPVVNHTGTPFRNYSMWGHYAADNGSDSAIARGVFDGTLGSKLIVGNYTSASGAASIDMLLEYRIFDATKVDFGNATFDDAEIAL